MRAIKFFELQVAFHLADVSERRSPELGNDLKFYVSNKTCLDQGCVMAAAKFMERLDRDEVNTEALLEKRSFERLMGYFRQHGGFYKLRYAVPTVFAEEMEQRAFSAAQVARLVEICLRAPPPGPKSRRKNRITTALTVAEDEENREVFGLTLGTFALKERYKKFKQILPITYAVYEDRTRRSIMSPVRLTSKDFVGGLLKRVRNRGALFQFCARYNEICRQLNALGYNFQQIQPPKHVVFPEVDLALKPWPEDVIL
jgi:hypothetical protein